jgi:hypothetical protein
MIAASLFVVAAFAASGPMTAAEAEMLVRCGVADDEIVAAARRLGGAAPADEEDAVALRAAGASEALIDRLFVSEPTLRRLRRLAERFDGARSRAAGVAYLVPKGWRAEDRATENGGRLVRIYAPDARPKEARRELYLFVRPQSGFGGRASEPLGEAASNALADLLEGATLRPRPGLATPTVVGRLRGSLRRTTGSSDDAEFEAGVAVVVDENELLVCAGYVAPSAGRDEVRALFNDFAASLAF